MKYIKRKIKRTLSRLKMLYQKIIRGYSDEEIWDLGRVTCSWLLPRLRCFEKKYLSDTNDCEYTRERRVQIMSIIYALQLTEKADKESLTKIEEKKMDEGLKLLGEHILSIWH